jgi:CubicO group peptidase (beta-lactamase class C family)
VASVGKWVAVATIATVVDKGELRWTDKVSKWLKDLKNDPKGDITLLQLLSHTSGIRPYQPYPATDNYNSLDSSVRKILPLDTVFTAGSRFQYGGLAMQIAGRMAEKAEKKKFEDIFETNIAKPLDMTGSHFVPVDTTGGHSPMLAGGLCTTLHDYMAFLKMIFNDGVYNGKHIISASSVSEMQKDQIKSAKVMPDEYIQKGLGMKHNGIY